MGPRCLEVAPSCWVVKEQAVTAANECDVVQGTTKILGLPKAQRI